MRHRPHGSVEPSTGAAHLRGTQFLRYLKSRLNRTTLQFVHLEPERKFLTMSSVSYQGGTLVLKEIRSNLMPCALQVDQRALALRGVSLRTTA